MSSSDRFAFLRSISANLAAHGAEAEDLLKLGKPDASLRETGLLAEELARLIEAKHGAAPADGNGASDADKQVARLKRLATSSLVSRDELRLFTRIRIDRNKVAHGRVGDHHMARDRLEDAYRLALSVRDRLGDQSAPPGSGRSSSAGASNSPPPPRPTPTNQPAATSPPAGAYAPPPPRPTPSYRPAAPSPPASALAPQASPRGPVNSAPPPRVTPAPPAAKPPPRGGNGTMIVVLIAVALAAIFVLVPSPPKSPPLPAAVPVVPRPPPPAAVPAARPPQPTPAQPPPSVAPSTPNRILCILPQGERMMTLADCRAARGVPYR